MSETKLKPVHPGEVLREEFLAQFGLSESELADQTGIQLDTVRSIINESSAVTADIALRLARFFGTSAQFWLGLQSDYDIDIARELLGDRLNKEIVPIAA